MNQCPHCSATSIGTWRKVTATPFSPAICSNCGEASFISAWSSTAIVVAAELLLWSSIVLALLLRSFFGLLALPVGLAATALLLARLFPLIPANHTVLETRRKVVRRTWAVIVIGLVAIIIFARYAG